MLPRYFSGLGGDTSGGGACEPATSSYITSGGQATIGEPFPATSSLCCSCEFNSKFILL